MAWCMCHDDDVFLRGNRGISVETRWFVGCVRCVGQDGRVLYRKSGECGEEALCIEHFEGRWLGLIQSDGVSVAYYAYVDVRCKV